MSFTLLLFIGLIIFIVLPAVLGVKMFKNNRRIASMLLLIPISFLIIISSFIYSLLYTTTPDALSLTVTEEAEQFIISGEWNKKHEKYAYGIDYIAIHTPQDTEIINTNIEAFTIKTMENQYLFDDLNRALQKNPNYDSTKEVHLFEIKLEKQFDAYFQISPQVAREDLIIQYIHVYYPPMDLFQYWVKTANGRVSDPLEMSR